MTPSKLTSPLFTRAILLGTLVCTLAGCGAGQSAKGESYTAPALQDESKALIVIYRPAQSWRANAGAYPEVFLDGNSMGVIRYQGYLTAEVSPSSRKLLFTGLSPAAHDWEFKDRTLPLRLKPGKTHYYEVIVIYDEKSNVLGRPGMDFTLQIIPSSEKTARYQLPDLKRSN